MPMFPPQLEQETWVVFSPASITVIRS